jgi:hypothetical protein
MSTDLPGLLPPPLANELESHEHFRSEFKKWLKHRAAQGLIMVGGESDHLESLMYSYLHPNDVSNVLTGRKLFITESGRVGVAPKHTKCGDTIIYLAGTLNALVLRKMERSAPDLGREIRRAFATEKHGGNHDRDEDEEEDHMEETEEDDEQEEEGDKGMSFSNLNRTKDMSIQHGILIGECYVEGVVGWLVGSEEELQYKIFALR